jgi:predicted Ser/Thr protein kinase
MAFAPGTRLGAYEIVGLIGAGGMGEVYRAVDRRLDRQAAIKVLPDAFRSDPERIARFEREAKLLATLNHPNVAAIYGLEQGDGQQFIVMELVEGETLADRIARGRISVPEVLEIAKQIAAALEAAHEKGVIHRDLKPANVKLTPDDQVKVLDFGLAKALDPAIGGAPSSPWLSNSPTITSPVGATGLGVLLGTAEYMSPEQARGKTVDKRSDIWAFGCVLFEMLTGKRAFEGEDVQSTLAAILRDVPDFSSLPGETSPAVKTVVERCLEKDPKRRIPDIAVVRFLLDDVAPLTRRSREPSIPGRLLRRHWVAAAATIGVGLAILGGLAGWLLDSRAASTRQTIRFEVAPPAGAVLAAGPQLAVSPDGRSIAYAAMVGSRYVLFVRRLDSVVSRELPGTEAASFPFWSPDGRTVGFFADGKLKKVDLARGQPQPLADVPRSVGATWSKDGFILFGAIGAGVQRVSESGGVPVQVTVLTKRRRWTHRSEVPARRPPFLLQCRQR